MKKWKTLLLQPTLLSSPHFSPLPHLKTASRKKYTQFHRIPLQVLLGFTPFNRGSECVFKLTWYFFIILSQFCQRHDRCVLIWALAVPVTLILMELNKFIRHYPTHWEIIIRVIYETGKSKSSTEPAIQP